MATAADRFANNVNFGALGKATELRQRLLFTVIIAALQGYGVSIGLESMQTAYGNIVFEPGFFLELQLLLHLLEEQSS